MQNHADQSRTMQVLCTLSGKLQNIIRKEVAVMDDAKVQAVINWPQNVKDLQRFLGLGRSVLETLAQTLYSCLFEKEDRKKLSETYSTRRDGILFFQKGFYYNVHNAGPKTSTSPGIVIKHLYPPSSVIPSSPVHIFL